MSHKNVTILSILRIWLGFDNKNMKLDQDIKIIFLGLYQSSY